MDDDCEKKSTKSVSFFSHNVRCQRSDDRDQKTEKKDGKQSMTAFLHLSSVICSLSSVF
jgi:hypothetical protein